MQSPPAGILSLLTFLPLIGALIVMFLPRPKDLPEAHGHGSDDHEAHGEPAPPSAPEPMDVGRMLVNTIALTFAVLPFLLSIALFGAYDMKFNNSRIGGIGGNMQFIENIPWIPLDATHSIRYHMGVDGISLLLVLLTTFLMVLCVLFSFGTKQRLKEFMVFLLLLETGMIGVFCALDLVLFYIFFEAMLIPMYFLIGIFGHENRIYAAIKFFIYTFAGSVFMLIAIVMVYSLTGSFDIVALSNPSAGAGAMLHLAKNAQALTWMFVAFSLAFAIKVPMFPFHTWLPDAHVEAPTAGSVILAGVMLKMGTYGFIRIVLPLFPSQSETYAFVFILLAVIGIIYGSIVAAVQPDAKKLVAYSSVAHLGFVILGIFSFTRIGMMGALVQNINHGISTPMLFFLVGMMYDRKHTREISQYGGLKKYVPMMATMLLIATLASIAVPFFNGFVGEFPVLLGSWISKVTYDIPTFGGYLPTALAATGMILSAVYMLWWYQRLMLGPITHPENRRLPDLSRMEWAVLTPLAAVIFWFGLGSTFWTQRMDAAVNLLLPQASPGLHEEINDNLPISEIMFHERTHDEKGIRDVTGRREPTGHRNPPPNMRPAGPQTQLRGAMPGGPMMGRPPVAPNRGMQPGAAPGAGTKPLGAPGGPGGTPRRPNTLQGAGQAGQGARPSTAPSGAPAGQPGPSGSRPETPAKPSQGTPPPPVGSSITPPPGGNPASPAPKRNLGPKIAPTPGRTNPTQQPGNRSAQSNASPSTETPAR